QKCERCLTVLERDAPVVEHDWAVSVRDEHTKRFYRMWKAVCMKCAEAVEGFHPFWLEKNLRHCKQCNRPVYKRWGRKAVLCSRQCQTRSYREQKRRQSGKVGAHFLCSVCSQPFQPKRRDAQFCSNACRQRKYRQETTSVKRREKTAMRRLDLSAEHRL